MIRGRAIRGIKPSRRFNMPAASKISVPLINDCLFTVHPTPWLRLNTLTRHGYSYGYALPVPSDDFTFFSGHGRNRRKAICHVECNLGQQGVSEEAICMELEQMSEEELMSTIEMVCLSKVEEMHLIGYEYVTSDDIWNCVSSKYEKEGVPSLHQLVNDILSLKATALMNYMTISAYKGSSFD